MPGDQIFHYIETHRTAEDDEWMQRSLDAEARGDAAAALECDEHVLQVVESPRRYELAYLAHLGDDAPGWLICRWILAQAKASLLMSGDPRVQMATVLVLAGTYELPDEDDDWAMLELGTGVAGTDWLVRELLVHTYSGLADFLDERARPELVARAPRIRDWIDEPLRVYRFVDLRDDRLTVLEVGSTRTHEVLHLGCALGMERDAMVLGRLVPSGVDPGLMFEWRPLEVDEETALELVDTLEADDPDEWVWTLAAAVGAGRQPYGLGRIGHSPLWSDAVGENLSRIEKQEPSGRVQALMDAGLPRLVAEAVTTCEVALLVAEKAPQALPAAASAAALALIHPVVVSALHEHLSGSEHRAGWAAIAACVPEPARSTCRALASA